MTEYERKNCKKWMSVDSLNCTYENGTGIYEGKVHYDRWDIEELHPINIGRNLFGVASCMAFLKVIFHLSIHYKFGPILFCIKQVRSNRLKTTTSYDTINIMQ